MIIVGVDYSMTCPALCFANPEWTWNFKNLGFNYLSAKKGEQKEWNVGAALMVGKPIPQYDNNVDRFSKIANQLILPWMVHREKEEVIFYIEGYSMGSKGRVFEIAEHAGMLKFFLFHYDIQFKIVPPTVIKKFATGKGNADKTAMHASFAHETGVNLMKTMFPDRTGVSSPVSDIVDSYYIAKYGVYDCGVSAKIDPLMMNQEVERGLHAAVDEQQANTN